MKKITIIGLLMMLLLLTGCKTVQETEPEPQKLGENQINLYYVNADKTELLTQVYTIDPEEDLSAQIDMVMQALADIQTTKDVATPIPEGIDYVSNNTESKHGRVELSFNVVYDALDADSLLFFKACVVKTVLQLNDVNTVALSLLDVANSDADTAIATENFDSESFTLSFGQDSGYKQKGTLTLYFANADGDQLKEYRKSIEISNNSSLARIVVEALIEGPKEDGYQATIPEGTKIRNLSVKDGICYVDLSDEFYNPDNPLKNDIIIYSIVDSLVELPTVSKVQFLKNGEKQQFFRETMPFDGIFERNLDLIEQGDTE